MGCTSSSTNTAELNLTDNTNNDKNVDALYDTKQDVQSSDDVDNEQNKTVLPLCDSLDQNLHLSRNNSTINIANQQVETVDHIMNNVEVKGSSEILIETHNQNELPSLKEVVNQVILDNIFQNVENISTVPDCDSTSNENTAKIEDNIDESHEIICVNEDTKEKLEHEEIFEESVSPSQSESSRATRWEALADIAAELPPSLAVDPLTGQIYSLTK